MMVKVPDLKEAEARYSDIEVLVERLERLEQKVRYMKTAVNDIERVFGMSAELTRIGGELEQTEAAIAELREELEEA